MIIISGYTPLSKAHYIYKKGYKLNGLEVPVQWQLVWEVL